MYMSIRLGDNGEANLCWSGQHFLLSSWVQIAKDFRVTQSDASLMEAKKKD